MGEFKELPIEQLHLNEKGQFNFAKFSQYVDELDDECFDDQVFSREKIKDLFFNVYNDRPKKTTLL